MKKLLVAALISVAVLFSSCNSAKADKFGWYTDYDGAKAAAQKKHENILLFVSSFEDDTRSASLNKDIFQTEEFKKFADTNSLVCINLNFSQSEYQASQVADTASDKEKKDAKKIHDTYEKNMRIVTGYYIEDTPSLFLTTEDGYLIAKLPCDESIIALADFTALVDAQAETSSHFKDLVNATKTGSDVEKAKAIDVLYEETAPESRFLLSDKIDSFLDLDKKNETGLVGKYLLASANVDAQNAYFDGDIEAAITAFDQVTKSEFSTAEEKQQAYYMAAYTLIQTGSQDVNRMIDLYQKAYDAGPDTDYAPQIQQTIALLQSMRDAQQQKPAETPEQQMGPAAQPETPAESASKK